MNTNLCKLCDKHINLGYEYTTPCNHEFCYICIKTYNLNGNTKCPTCNITINIADDFKFERIHELKRNNYVWLYNSNYGGHWWCYDSTITSQLENIYKDYQKRIALNNNNTSDIQIDNKSLNRKKKSSNNANVGFDGFVNINDDGIDTNIKLDLKSDDDENEEEEIVEPVSYEINIGCFKYKIDVENMKQINIRDSFKQRTIKRISIDQNLSDEDMKQYLMVNSRILGVSGIKF